MWIPRYMNLSTHSICWSLIVMFLPGFLSLIIIVFVLFELIFSPSSLDFYMIILTALCRLCILFRPLAAMHTSSANIKRLTP